MTIWIIFLFNEKFVFLPYISVNCLIFQHNDNLEFYSCAKVFPSDYTKSCLSVAHNIIVWFYYHLLLTKNSFILTKTYFGIFGYFSNKERLLQKNLDFNFHQLSGLLKIFKSLGRPWTWTIFKIIEMFVFLDCSLLNFFNIPA